MIEPWQGLPLPPGVVQPFDLAYAVDDLHVIAFVTGDPRFGAVEATLTRRPGRAPLARATLTRHDMSQIHCTDDVQAEEMSEGERPRVRLAFRLPTGQPVELDFRAAGRPSPMRGGLTDPGGHAGHDSLPLMWRGASALAASDTRVVIDGHERALPVKLTMPHFIGLNGFYTERHTIGLIRAGSVTADPLDVPDGPIVGQAWRFARDDGEICYRIVRAEADGRVVILSDGPEPEVIQGRFAEGRLTVQSIRKSPDATSNAGLTLSFGGDGYFTAAIDGHNVVDGRFQMTDGHRLRLLPTAPAWALARTVNVACRREGESFRFLTGVGAA
jgi:hypothetical protein